MKKFLSFLLALAMMLSLVACGGGSTGETPKDDGGDAPASEPVDSVNKDAVEEASAGDVDNGDGSYYNEALGYTYGTKFYSDEPVTYTMFFNDNDAYPIMDSWQEEGGVFAEIEKATNVHLDITIVNNASYTDKVSLAVSSGTAPYIIPKTYNETPYVNGGGIIAVSDYTQYMPNFTNFYNDYNMAADVDTIRQDDGKFYRLPGMKETALQDYTLLLRDDIFEAAGYNVAELEKDWTWDEFADILIGVKAYMVEQGMCSESDYIWTDRWCGSTSGYGTGGCLLNLISRSYGIYTTWSSVATNMADLYFDEADDCFKVSSTSDAYKAYMTVVQKLVSNKILDPETWSQEDTVADSAFYTGKTALILTNRSQTTAQVEGLKAQLGEGNFSVYRCVIPMGVDADGNKITYQAENSRLECGVMISSKALNDLGEDEFIKLMRFVDWLWYSDAGLTLTKWGVEGVTYTVEDGVYSLTPGYYCGGLSIAQSSDDQEDMRLKYGFACGNFMYGGTAELLTSNFAPDLRDFYDRQGEYRTLKPLDPSIALSEDDSEMANLWATPLFSEMNTWTCKFAMGQADINADWDTYVAAIESQNVQNIVDLYNDYYQASK
ncbi:MAG: hypothetical protein ACI3U8_05495 [Candidatus Onthomonas sp.]